MTSNEVPINDHPFLPHDVINCWCRSEIVVFKVDEGGREWYGERHNYENHTCTCEDCGDFPARDDADWTPSIDGADLPTRWPKRIWVDGESIPEVMAAKVGPSGWVIALARLPGDTRTAPPTRAHVCGTCFQQACQFVKRGNVEIEWKAIEAPVH